MAKRWINIKTRKYGWYSYYIAGSTLYYFRPAASDVYVGKANNDESAVTLARSDAKSRAGEIVDIELKL